MIDTCQDKQCTLKDRCYRYGEKRQGQIIEFKHKNCVHFWDKNITIKKQL